MSLCVVIANGTIGLLDLMNSIFRVLNMPENTKFLGAVNRLRFPEGRVKVFFDTFFKI